MQRRKRIALAVAVAVISCAPTYDGDKGVAQFLPSQCIDFGTDSDRCITNALAPGGAILDFTITPANGGCGTTVNFASAGSSNPSVLTATKLDAHTVRVTSGQPGSAEVQLLDNSGSVIDSYPLGVMEVGSMQFGGYGLQSAISTSTPVQVIADHVWTVHVQAWAKADPYQKLHDEGAISYRLSGPITQDAAAPFDMTGVPSKTFPGDAVAFHGTSGSASIVATSGTAAATLMVRVVDPSEIATVAFGAQYQVIDQGQHEVAVDTAPALADGTAVFSDQLCAWTTDPAISVNTRPNQFAAGPPTSLDFTDIDRNYFIVPKLGSYAATCTIYGVSATVMVTRTQ